MTRFGLLKAMGAPGSLGFLAAGIVIGCVLLWFRRTRRLGKLLLAALGVSYLVLSVPAFARVLSDRAGAVKPEAASAFGPANDIIVLDGDNYQGRAARAAELFVTASPRTVWILGADDLRQALIDHGIPVDRLKWFGVPDDDQTTFGQIAYIQQTMRAKGIVRPMVVASRVQASRVASLVRQQGIDATVIAAWMDREPIATGAGRWVPSLAALALSRDALYEWAAQAYYQLKGWIP